MPLSFLLLLAFHGIPVSCAQFRRSWPLPLVPRVLHHQGHLVGPPSWRVEVEMEIGVSLDAEVRYHVCVKRRY